MPGEIDLITRIPVDLRPDTEPAATMPAGSPRAVVAARTGQNAAKVTWSDPTPPKGHTIVGYRVARNGVDTYGGGAYAKTLGAAAHSFTMNYLVLGNTYTLSVQALYSGGTKSAAASAPVFIGWRLPAALPRLSALGTAHRSGWARAYHPNSGTRGYG